MMCRLVGVHKQRSLVVGILVILVALLAPVSPAVAQPVSTTVQLTDPGDYADAELIDALEGAALMGEWMTAAKLSETTSFLRVYGSDAYGQSRSTLLKDLATLQYGTSYLFERDARLVEAKTQARTLRRFIRDVVDRSAEAQGFDPILTPADMDTLEALVGTGDHGGSLGFSTDSLDILEYQLRRLRYAAVAAANEVLNAQASGRPTAGPAGQFDLVADQLKPLGFLTRIAEEAVEGRRAELVALHNDVVKRLPGVQTQQALASTFVEGLPAVTLDAYVRGAESLPSGCSVDWRMLAGIGRIESIHGTLGESTVAASGSVTEPIYGPLLDGGASDGDADRARREAEAEAERLAAEAAAAAAIGAAAERSRQLELFGEDYVLRVESLESLDGVPEELEGFAGNPIVEDPMDPDVEFGETSSALDAAGDPGAGQERSSVDESANTSDEDGDEGSEEESQGNGFAVIRDSDDGRLDGNAAWDRAVGPMQFIPETWELFKVDGDGDGRLDPQNFYDAAASAGNYLCHLERRFGSNPARFILGYNDSDVYVERVLGVAADFAEYQLPEVDFTD